MRKILEDNPLTTKLLQKWFTKKMERAVEGRTLSEEYKKSFMTEVISIEKLAPIIEVNPRSLFDFFDESYIHILPVMNGGNFSATINGEPLDGTERGKVYTLRITAENDAVKEAFPILEKILENE